MSNWTLGYGEQDYLARPEDQNVESSLRACTLVRLPRATLILSVGLPI